MHLDLKVIATIFRNIDIELRNVDPKKNLIGQPTGKKMHPDKVNLITGITTHGIVLIIVVNMVIFHKTISRHILERNTRVD